MSEQQIKDLWPLSSGFEYASEVGLALRMVQPRWWQIFEEETLSEPLPQSHGLNFIAWVEQNNDLEEREKWLSLALSYCGAKVLSEVEAELESRERDLTPIEDLDPLPELDGEKVYLYAPEECRGYPSGRSDHLDRWTEQALQGAVVVDKESKPIESEAFYLVHSPDYIRGLLVQSERGGLLTPETIVTEDTPAAITAAAGALLTASKEALQDSETIRLAQVRPGSHHAGVSRACGTCLVNSLALVARVALQEDRGPVAILDIDAHHGNGTESILLDEPNALTVSLHQAPPFFPGTGQVLERGYGQESNLNLNIGPSQSWRDQLDTALTAISRFHPNLVLVEFSADAHRSDPVSNLSAQDGDYAYLGQRLRQMRVATVFELGASLSERAWVGAVRSLIIGWQKGAEDIALRQDVSNAPNNNPFSNNPFSSPTD